MSYKTKLYKKVDARLANAKAANLKLSEAFCEKQCGDLFEALAAAERAAGAAVESSEELQGLQLQQLLRRHAQQDRPVTIWECRLHHDAVQHKVMPYADVSQRVLRLALTRRLCAV